MRGVLSFLLIAWVSLLAGCAGTIEREVVPAELVAKAEVRGLPEVRFWGDERSAALDKSLSTRIEQVVKSGRSAALNRGQRVNVDFLALSGGGGDGAFGAGLLVGWSEHKSRPVFEIVTGVSTGALMAPFAFLGSRYDPQLREIYTTLATNDLVAPQLLAGLFGGDALGDSAPLARQIERFVDQALLAEIAAEHRKGRRLYVATTNIDAERPVIWDMGAIAQAGGLDALRTFRSVLLASASIPGVFPPVRLRVKAGGREYDEMHVDGGITAQVFFLPFDALLDRYAAGKVNTRQINRRLFVIRNTKVNPEWQATKDRTLPIVERSLATLTKNQGVGDLYKLYLEARSQRMEFFYGAIPSDFAVKSSEFFDRAYMNALFDQGFQLGRRGYDWQTHPPGLTEHLVRR